MAGNANAAVARVALAAARMDPRGTSEYTLNLARELKASGVDVAVFCAPGPLVERLQTADVDVATFPHLASGRLRLRERARLLEAVREFDPQLVHAQSLRVAPCLRLLAKDGSTPLALTVHWVPEGLRTMRRLSELVSGIIVPTQAVRQGLVNQCRVPREKIKVIANGVDIAAIDEADVPAIFGTDVAVVGSLGPIEAGRGHDLFARAAAQLMGRGVTAQFVVAGAGEGVRELRKLVADLGLEHHMTLATDFAAYQDVLRAPDIVVQSSQVDVSGFSILEAMGHGRPVIAFNTGTACELIKDRQTGMLIPKGDVAALVDAIGELVADPETARRIGEQARRRVRERFNVRALARQTMQYYEDILNS